MPVKRRKAMAGIETCRLYGARIFCQDATHSYHAPWQGRYQGVAGCDERRGRLLNIECRM